MPSAVRLREDYSAEELRALARRSKNVNQSRRLLSLAAVRDGMDRGGGGEDRRAWTARRCATGSIASTPSGPEGLIDNWTEGPKPRLSAEQLAQFAQIVEAGPDREKDGVVRWRRIDLKRVIAERFGVDFHPRYVGKLLQEAWLLPHQCAAPSSGSGRADRRGVSKKLPARAEGSSRRTAARRRRSKSGLRTRPGSARRTASSGNGPGAERGQGSPPTSATTTPICSARSARPAASGRPSCCPTPTLT